ncbi:MAG: hypothetical protein ABSE97_05635 [Verrucomicrobiota bacterium]|jgi:hypothetical protein
MNIHRVKHRTIPVSAFKPDKTNGHRSKVLRWFENEHLKHPHDCLLRVENERGEDFELWADFVSVPLNALKGEVIPIITGSESLAQSIVAEIEVSTNTALARDCDFVIFQNSPVCRAECLHQGQ